MYEFFILYYKNFIINERNAKLGSVALTVVRFGCCSLVGGHKFDEFFLSPTNTQTAIYHNVNEKQLC
jgi:hypothetical protein